MSLKYEQYSSLWQTREFLRTLLRPDLTPRVPRAIRQEAVRCLRHYPFLHTNGKPIFSQDEFPCPSLEKSIYSVV